MRKLVYILIITKIIVFYSWSQINTEPISKLGSTYQSIVNLATRNNIPYQRVYSTDNSGKEGLGLTYNTWVEVCIFTNDICVEHIISGDFHGIYDWLLAISSLEQKNYITKFSGYGATFVLGLWTGTLPGKDAAGKKVTILFESSKTSCKLTLKF